MRRVCIVVIAAIGVTALTRVGVAQDKDLKPPAELAEFFRPPEKYRDELRRISLPAQVRRWDLRQDAARLATASA